MKKSKHSWEGKSSFQSTLSMKDDGQNGKSSGHGWYELGGYQWGSGLGPFQGSYKESNQQNDSQQTNYRDGGASPQGGLGRGRYAQVDKKQCQCYNYRRCGNSSNEFYKQTSK